MKKFQHFKALYGLKQAPRARNNNLFNTLKEHGFKQCTADNCILFDGNLLIAVYVDDLAGKSIHISEFKNEVSKRFKLIKLN